MTTGERSMDPTAVTVKAHPRKRNIITSSWKTIAQVRRLEADEIEGCQETTVMQRVLLKEERESKEAN